MLTAAFPSGVLGPVDFNALRRLASNCFSVATELSYPKLLIINRMLAVGGGSTPGPLADARGSDERTGKRYCLIHEEFNPGG